MTHFFYKKKKKKKKKEAKSLFGDFVTDGGFKVTLRLLPSNTTLFRLHLHKISPLKS